MRNLTCPDDTPAGSSDGHVIFVGAGPGAADLLTVRAIRALQAADVVLHDALGCTEALGFCAQARQVAVGKRAAGITTDQGHINQCLIREAGLGNLVVRLKGGDPAVFGRLDEELDALIGAGIAYTIVPGITAANAAAAAAGISLTRRGVARSLVITTPAVGRGENANPTWGGAGTGDATLAVYMAGRIRARTAQELIAAGFEPSTPAIVASAVSTPAQRLAATTLAELAGAPVQRDSAAALSINLAETDFGEPCLLLVGRALRAPVLRSSALPLPVPAASAPPSPTETAPTCTVRAWHSYQFSQPNSHSATPPSSTVSTSSSMPANASV